MSRLRSWSWRTPLGAGVVARDAALRGESGLTPAGPEHLGVTHVGRLPGEPAPAPHARYLHRAALFGFEAAIEVAEPWSGDRDRLGVFTGLGGLRALWGDLDVAMAGQRPDGAAPWANGLGKVHPYWMLRHLSNNAHALLAIALGARGEGTTVAGPTGGAGALGAAVRALRAGRIDAAVVMACDTLLQPEFLLDWNIGEAPGEAAVALLLTHDACIDTCVDTCIDVSGGLAPLPAEPSHVGLPIDVRRAFGDLGAATALAQVVLLAGLGPGRWYADSEGAPGLAARVRVRA